MRSDGCQDMEKATNRDDLGESGLVCRMSSQELDTLDAEVVKVLLQFSRKGSRESSSRRRSIAQPQQKIIAFFTHQHFLINEAQGRALHSSDILGLNLVSDDLRYFDQSWDVTRQTNPGKSHQQTGHGPLEDETCIGA